MEEWKKITHLQVKVQYSEVFFIFFVLFLNSARDRKLNLHIIQVKSS